MKARRKILAADLFCGAGGTSQGLLLAANHIHADLELVAVNHWQTAIDTHLLNHPEQRHLCTGLAEVDPLKVVPGGRLHVLCASPECTHHSVARGGKPMDDQSRSSPMLILDWLTKLYVDNVIIENVPEFLTWGPLGVDRRPLKSMRGRLFEAWVEQIRAMGYRVEWRVLNCADYGAPTTRRRLFIICRKRNRKIRWPEPTHVAPVSTDQGVMFAEGGPAWRTAREIIDWSKPSKDIFDRKKSLSPNTLRRISAGMLKFNGIRIDLEKCVREGLRPYLVVLRGTGSSASVDQPLHTVTAGGNHYGLVQPFLLPHRTFANMNADDLADPLRTVTATSADFALVEPFLASFRGSHSGKADGDKRTESLSDPLPTQDTSNRFGLVEPFLTASGGAEGQGRNPHSVDKPVGAVLTNDRRALAQPFIATVTHAGGDRVRSIDQPLATVTRSMGDGVATPFLSAYYGTNNLCGVDEPVPTVVTKDRFALTLPKWIREGDLVYRLEIRFRMLDPRELARAQDFPDEYQFSGNREDVVKQIGNAVPPGVAKALALEVLQ